VASKEAEGEAKEAEERERGELLAAEEEEAEGKEEDAVEEALEEEVEEEVENDACCSVSFKCCQCDLSTFLLRG
jgi:hypothetical protein